MRASQFHVSRCGRLVEIASYSRLLSAALNSSLSFVLFSSPSTCFASPPAPLLYVFYEAGQQVGRSPFYSNHGHGSISMLADHLPLPVFQARLHPKEGMVCPRFYFHEPASMLYLRVFSFLPLYYYIYILSAHKQQPFRFVTSDGEPMNFFLFFIFFT